MLYAKIVSIFISMVFLAFDDVAKCLDSRLTSWIKSTGNGSGNYSDVPANVLAIYHTDQLVYINANSIPSYGIGPWNDNPNIAIAQNLTASVPRVPRPALEKTETGLGAIGLFTNGVAVFNAWDARTYNSVWQTNAFIVEGVSFDSCNGHPQQTGFYHNHINPICLYDSTDSNVHSPIIGWAFDGYPIYGSFGFSNPTDKSSTIKRMASSYLFRSYVNNKRRSLPNKKFLLPKYYGPDVNSTYFLGYFLQDFEYVRGSGDLDEYNGRWCVTPDFPFGTYAYFVTTNSSGFPAYPYILGPSYYGVVESTNTSVAIPSNANKFFSIY